MRTFCGGSCYSWRSISVKQQAFKIGISILAPLCIWTMANFARVHTDGTDRIKLSCLIDRVTPPHVVVAARVLSTPTSLSFFVASMVFSALAYAYRKLNDDHRYQDFVLLTMSASGLVVATTLGTGVLVGIFSVGTTSLFLGLVLSDVLHLTKRALSGSGRRREGEWWNEELKDHHSLVLPDLEAPDSACVEQDDQERTLIELGQDSAAMERTKRVACCRIHDSNG